MPEPAGRTPWLVCVALLLQCGLVGSAERAPISDSQLPSRTTPSSLPPGPGPSPGQLLLVSLADGRLEALDRETGQPLWTFHTGAPLVSSTNRATSTTPAAGHGQAAAAATGAAEAGNRESIFPGTDGSLYVYRPTPTDGGGSGGDVGPLIERLPLTVAELVHSCPAPALDGSLLMGSQHTTAFLLHAPTGRLLRTFFDFDGQLGQLDAAGLGLGEEELTLGAGAASASVVVVGRKDYVVRSVHPELGERWTVSWSQVTWLADLEARQVDEDPAGSGGSGILGAGGRTVLLPAAARAGGPAAAAGASAGGGELQLLVGADFDLQALQPGGWQLWQRQFSSPPLGAFAVTTGASPVDLLTRSRQQLLEQQQEQRQQRQEQQQQHRRPWPQLPGPNSSGGGGPGSTGWSQVIVHSLNGSLYAIPAWQVAFGVGPAGGQCAVQAPGPTVGTDTADGDSGGSCSAFAGLRGMFKSTTPASAEGGGAAAYWAQRRQQAGEEEEEAAVARRWHPSTALVVPRRQGDQGVVGAWGEDEEGEAVPPEECASEAGRGEEVCAVKPGLYSVHAGTSGGSLLLLPPSSNESGAGGSKGRHQQEQQRWAALWSGGWVSLVLAGAAGAGGAVVAVLLLARRGRAAAVPSSKEKKQQQQGSAAAAAKGTNGSHHSANGVQEPTQPAGKGVKKKGRAAKAGSDNPPPSPPLSSRLKGMVQQMQAEAAAEESRSRESSQESSDAHGSDPTSPGSILSSPSSTFEESPRQAQQQQQAAAAPAVAGPGRPPAPVPKRATVPLPPATDGSEHMHFGPSALAAAVAAAGRLGRRTVSMPSRTMAQAVLAPAAGGTGSGEIRRREMEGGVALVGRMRVGPKILGYGSGGTIVYEGELDGRPVAIKRLLHQFYDLAKKEIGALILSDEHPNVVRCFAMEEDNEFCYLALERCKCTLADAMASESARGKFVGPDGEPTAFAYQVARDIGRGLTALHERGIVHRDLKPHNVLLTEGGVAKLSDMGLSKRLVPEQSSFESVGSGGSSGWQAPEQLVGRSGGAARLTKALDVFSYGLLLHFCLTGGKHPFGESFERDANILMGRLTLRHLAHLPEVASVVRGACALKPAARPPVAPVLAHLLWWDPPRRLAFLIDISDRVEGEDRAEDSRLYAALEALGEEAVGPGGSWAAKLDSGLVNNLGKYRRYSYTSLRDLLRVIRNKHSHYRELPAELQRRLGTIPEGFLSYFTSRFPGLLNACYFFALRWCSEEPVFQKYFPPGTSALLDTLAPAIVRQPPPPPTPALVEEASVAGVGPGVEPAIPGSSRGGSSGSAAPSPAAAMAAGGGGASSHPPVTVQRLPPGSGSPAAVAAAAMAAAHDFPPFAHHQPSPSPSAPPPPQQQQQWQLRHGSGPGSPSYASSSYASAAAGAGVAAAAAAASAPSPVVVEAPPPPSPPSLLAGPRIPGQVPAQALPPVGVVDDGDATIPLFPSRPGHPVCDFYQKTGHCQFGEACKFDHPPEYAVRLNRRGLPLRPGQPTCAFYERTGDCKFGPRCKFHHPNR